VFITANRAKLYNIVSRAQLKNAFWSAASFRGRCFVRTRALILSKLFEKVDVPRARWAVLKTRLHTRAHTNIYIFIYLYYIIKHFARAYRVRRLRSDARRDY